MPRTPKKHPPIQSRASSVSKTTGFRLEDRFLEMLEEEAAAQGVSRHELAKRWVVERLESLDGPVTWQEAAATLLTHLIRTRQDLALGFQALLVRAGSVSAEEAQAWADRNFREK